MARPACAQPAPPEVLGKLLDWQTLDSWTTPANNFFQVNHFGLPAGLNESTWKLEISGQVARPRTLTLADIKARPLQEVDNGQITRRVRIP